MEWTNGMEYWTDLFALKIIFVTYNNIRTCILLLINQ